MYCTINSYLFFPLNPDGCEVLLVRFKSLIILNKGGRVQQDLPPISLNAFPATNIGKILTS